MVMTVYAPDSKKNNWKCTKNVSPVWLKFSANRKGGARDFYITGDFNVELGLMCTDENDEEELTKMYGPSCWHGYDKDPDGFKKTCGMGL